MFQGFLYGDIPAYEDDKWVRFKLVLVFDVVDSVVGEEEGGGGKGNAAWVDEVVVGDASDGVESDCGVGESDCGVGESECGVGESEYGEE